MQFELYRDLTPLMEDHALVAAGLGPGPDELTLLLVDASHSESPFGCLEQPGWATFPDSRALQPYPASVVRLKGDTVVRSELSRVELAHPKIQPLPEGRVLLAGSRCRRFPDGTHELNGHIYSEHGEVERQVLLGDGIQSVQADRQGRIWVSYFDEGVFGTYGWDEPVGQAGLNRFSSEGVLEYSFQPPEGFDSICDCYALNVADDGAWACYYTDFPLVHVSANGPARGWRNSMSCSALAVAPGQALLFGARTATVTLVELGEEETREVKSFEPAFPVGALVEGRGRGLAAIAPTGWYRLSL